MEGKKKLNLEVKTLETRIAPGMCRATHNAQANSGRIDGSQWSFNRETGTYERHDFSNPGNSSTHNGDIPAGVPVIGIN